MFYITSHNPQNAKNALEAYIYSLRNKLYEGLEPYLKPADRDALAGRLSALEDWLYDEGEDETKSVYVAKLQVGGFRLVSTAGWQFYVVRFLGVSSLILGRPPRRISGCNSQL